MSEHADIVVVHYLSSITALVCFDLATAYSPQVTLACAKRCAVDYRIGGARGAPTKRTGFSLGCI